ncbi:hypothetical protein GBA52_009979 [Prunus armeniaca]|nr:hypothetical protein GBA52_009979 [Prunus armeniaca]
MAKLLLVSASALVFVILLLELRLSYSSAEPQRPIKCKLFSSDFRNGSSTSTRPLRILTNAGRDRDHPRKPSQASPKAPPGGHP